MIPRDPKNLSQFIIETSVDELAAKLANPTVQHEFFTAIDACKLVGRRDLAEKVSNVVHTQNLNEVEQKVLLTFVITLTRKPKKDALNRLLLEAVLHGAHGGFIASLLKEGADPEQIKDIPQLKAYLASQDPVNGETPLAKAIFNKEFERAKLLITLGANPKAINSNKAPVLWRAMLNSSEDNKWHDVIRLLLEKGANPNVIINTVSLLHRVAINDPIVLQMLLDYGALPNVQDLEKKTPLFYAVEMNNLETAEILLKDKRTIINWIDASQTAPLYLALIQGKEEMAKLLEKYGANVNAIDKEGFVPMCYECFEDRIDVMPRLLAHGADQGLAKEIMDRKALAHIHAIGGSTEIKVHGETNWIDLGGFFAVKSIQIASDYLEKFIYQKEQEHTSQDILQSLQKIVAAFEQVSFGENLLNAELYQRIKQGLPAIFQTGWPGHTIMVVIYKGNVVICNTGIGGEEQIEGRMRTGVVYKLGDFSDDKLLDLVNFLSLSYINAEEFKTKFSEFGLVRTDTGDDVIQIIQKGQKVENCSWAGTKTVVLTLLMLEFGQEKGHKFFKEYGAFAKEHSFIDYITDHTTQEGMTPNTDYDLLLQIEEKKLAKQLKEIEKHIADFINNKPSKTSAELIDHLNKQRALWDQLIKVNNDYKQKGCYSLRIYGDHSLKISDLGLKMMNLNQKLIQAIQAKTKQ